MFFFARLWRRSGVMTDLEFYELRYSGRAASVVRGFRAVYLGLFFNCFIMGMVTLAAYKIANSSTFLTHLNWGSSYLVHDFYRRFINTSADEKHYVNVGRVCTAGLYIVAALLSLVLESAQDAFEVLISIGAGTGLFYLLRWYW